ncbi:hypothetical protein AB0I10_19670 [Streptomyces sp. NPDC050636]|uniref:effector-associated constant component EACC1 n=1 Tax=Streptomyces sp. NPDC050636 TaxID=3154510 RepID=UPI00343213C6
MDALVVVGSEGEWDAEESERLTRRLRAEIAELDVESVRPLPGAPAPEGAKSGDAIAFGAIVVALSASGGVFTQLIALLGDWLGRQSARHRISVTIDDDTLELEQATADERRQLIDAFVQRHGTGS